MKRIRNLVLVLAMLAGMIIVPYTNTQPVYAEELTTVAISVNDYGYGYYLASGADSGSWNTCINASISTNYNGNVLRISPRSSGSTTQDCRSYMKFDTSVIPLGSEIVAAVVRVDFNTPDLQGTLANKAAVLTRLTTSSFGLNTWSSTGGALDSTPTDMSSSGSRDFTILSSQLNYLNRDGYTYFGLMDYYYDYGGTYMGYGNGYDTTSTSSPILYVSYHQLRLRVSTSPISFFQNKYMFVGSLDSLGLHTSADVYFEYGYGDLTVSGNARTETQHRLISKTGLFSVLVDNLSEIQMHVRAVAKSGTETVYGLDVIFTVVKEAACSVYPAQNVDFYTADLSCSLDSIGAYASVNFELDYGLTPACSDSTQPIGTALTQAAFYNFTLTSLAENTTYYYRAKITPQPSGAFVYSQTLPFKTHDSTKAKVINSINDFLIAHGIPIGVWWLFIGLLMLLPWFFEPIREAKYLGIIIDFVFLGFGITSVFDIWVTIILAVVAAALISAVIIKKVVNPQ